MSKTAPPMGKTAPPIPTVDRAKYALPEDVVDYINSFSESLKASSVVSALVFAGGSSLFSIAFPDGRSNLISIFDCFGFSALLVNLAACIVSAFLIHGISSLPDYARELFATENGLSGTGENSLPYILYAQKNHPAGDLNQHRLLTANEDHNRWRLSPSSNLQFLCDLGLPPHLVPLIRIWHVTTLAGIFLIALQLTVCSWILGGFVVGLCTLTTLGVLAACIGFSFILKPRRTLRILQPVTGYDISKLEKAL